MTDKPVDRPAFPGFNSLADGATMRQYYKAASLEAAYQNLLLLAPKVNIGNDLGAMLLATCAGNIADALLLEDAEHENKH